MNYLTEVLAFTDFTLMNKLSTGQIALWYALIAANNKHHWDEWFEVPNQTLEQMTGLSRNGIAVARNVLKQKGLINFKPNGTKATSYRLYAFSTTMQDIVQDTVQNTVQSSVQNTVQDTVQNSVQNSGTLYKQNKNKTKPNKNRDIECAQEKVSRHKYGEYKNVLLSDEELEKLQSEFPYDWQTRIERLSEYIASTGKSYKSHLATIRAWARKEREATSAGTNDRKWCTGNELSPEEVFGIKEDKNHE